MFNFFRVDVIQCGLQVVKRSKYEEEKKGENVKLRKNNELVVVALVSSLPPPPNASNSSAEGLPQTRGAWGGEPLTKIFFFKPIFSKYTERFQL